MELSPAFSASTDLLRFNNFLSSPGVKRMWFMTAVTVITRLSSVTTMFVVVAHLAAVCVYPVASSPNTWVIPGEVGFFQSHRI
ncbi:MAG: hypothetical protein HOE78_04300, partial [Gammaproteobacteria bacterium]|nr:hypothetical protein [Gammaproteobacteria bacterium]